MCSEGASGLTSTEGLPALLQSYRIYVAQNQLKNVIDFGFRFSRPQFGLVRLFSFTNEQHLKEKEEVWGFIKPDKPRIISLFEETLELTFKATYYKT